MIYTALYLEFLSGQPTFDPAGPSRLITLLDFLTFTANFESSSLESLVVSKTFSNSIVGTILARVEVIGCTRSCDHWIYAESWNARTSRSLLFPLFLFFFPLTFKGRRCIFIAQLSLCRAHAGAVDEKSQRLDEKFKMSVQYPPRFYWSSERDVSCGSTRSSSRSPSRFFHAHAHLPCSPLAKNR